MIYGSSRRSFLIIMLRGTPALRKPGKPPCLLRVQGPASDTPDDFPNMLTWNLIFYFKIFYLLI